MKNITCKHHGFAVAKLVSLPKNQGGPARHTCVICAYASGLHLASKPDFDLEAYLNSTEEKWTCPHGLVAPFKILADLPFSEGGVSRHKCSCCAFNWGVEAGSRPIETTNKRIHVTAPPVSMLKPTQDPIGRKTDFLEKEIRNQKLGLAGELVILEYEKSRLIEAGRGDLASAVEHVSAVIGDHLGFDIKSYTADAKEKYIEVKTTQGVIDTPFHISENQLRQSEKYSSSYFVYRLYDFSTEYKDVSLYILSGDMGSVLELRPTEFLALPKGE